MRHARYFFPCENIQRKTETSSADGRWIGDVDANEGILQIDLLAHEAVIVGADDRHVFQVSGLVGIDNRTIDARSPDSIDLFTGADQVFHFLRALVKGPTGEDRCNDLDIWILLERLSEALMAVSVGRHSVDASHLDDTGFAAKLLEQSLGP